MNWQSYGDDPLLQDYAALEAGGWQILVRRGMEEWGADVGRGLAPTVRMMGGGRAAHPVVGVAGGGEAVVRRFHRGGMMRHLNRDRYFLGHRAFDELRVMEHARGAGVRVPEPLAAAERPASPGYEALIATRLVSPAMALDEWLHAHPDRRALVLPRAGEQIGRMHAAGIAHPDLNLRNLLIAGDAADPEVYLLDFDRAQLLPSAVPAARRTRDLKRLGRSASKLGLPLTPFNWQTLGRGYGDGWPFSPGESPSLR